MSRHQNAGKKYTSNVIIANKSSENVTNFKYLGRAVTNKNPFTNKLRTD
jgi:hypothetical protein